MRIDLPIGAAVAAIAALGAIPAAFAALIEGQIAFPGQTVPPMTAYACEVDTSRILTVSVAPGQARFAVEVPTGRYIVFLAPSAPGAPNIYGAHTWYSVCAAQTPDSVGAQHEACTDHSLAEVILGTRAAHALVSIDDWYLSDEIASQLDRIRGIEASSTAEPLAAPRFSEYKANAFETTAAPKPDFGDSSLAPGDRAKLQQALASGPNFAGSLSLVRARCGNACDHVVLLDWHSGRVLEPAGPGEIRDPLPCRPEDAVLFRRDSRLLSITSVHADGLLTQYFVWKPDSGALALTAQFQRTAQQFCAALPP
ncbi:MAG: hypothetical protein ACHQIL_08345 [Steroidobacterales bacterium]